ncbi:hypothetical protein ACFLVX_04470 [Chloroflexota bacterium]
MNAYMIISQKSINPFGDHPRDCLITNQTLATLQQDALLSLRLELRPLQSATDIVDSSEHIVFADSLYFTRELLKEFLTQSRGLQRRTVCSAKPGVATLRSVVNTQDVRVYPDRIEYGLHYVPAGSVMDEPVAVVIGLDQFREAFNMPEHMFGGKEYPIQMTDLLIAQIDHWTNLLAMNVATLLSGGAKLKKASRLPLLALALKARSFNQWRVASTLNHIGHHCDIHPTAYIEGSTIGNNVRVGAGSIIRESVVADNTYVANRVTIDLSSVGADCFIRDGAVVQYSVLYPGSYVSNRLVSLSLCGRDTFLGDGAVLTDFRFDRQPVTVMKGGVQISTDNTFVGCCLGHRVYLGACVVLAPGRAIPNGMRISLDETRVIQKCHANKRISGHRTVQVSSDGRAIAD